MVAIGVDTNGQLFLLAYAIDEGEKTKIGVGSWHAFRQR